MSYDSTTDTLKHIKRVNEFMGMVAQEFIRRGNVHDQSKLEEPEKSMFDVAPPTKGIEYGSDAYADSRKILDKALQHHYSLNSHHPQFYPNGVSGMDLFDLVEMFFDWKAASERYKNGNIRDSILINKERFEMDPQVAQIMLNTAKKLGWIDNDETIKED